MSVLKKLLKGLLTFSLLLLLVPQSSWSLDRETMIFREALGLYNTNQFTFGLVIMEKTKEKLQKPASHLLLGYLYEATKNFEQADTHLSYAWKKSTRREIVLSAATEEAALMGGLFNNRLAASIVLELASQKTKPGQKEYCYSMFNIVYEKYTAKLDYSKDLNQLLQDCRRSWVYNLIPQSMLRKHYQTPTPLQNEP